MTCLPPDNSFPLKGDLATLEGIRREHIPSLWKNLDIPNHPELFEYLPLANPKDEEELWTLLAGAKGIANVTITFWAIKANLQRLSPRASSSSAEHNEVVGVIGVLDVQPQHRALEIGGLIFSPALQRTACATEVHYLLLRHVLETETAGQLPYRRIAYKCNSRNVKSRRAAERLGYTYEGTFRKHYIVKGQNRDSDWLSMLDDEWPLRKASLEAWLDKDNFDAEGRQISTLEAIRAGVASRQN